MIKLQKKVHFLYIDIQTFPIKLKISCMSSETNYSSHVGRLMIQKLKPIFLYIIRHE